MEYTIYKFTFLSGVHFGAGTLESAQHAFCADTLYSALCTEATGLDCLKEFTEYAESDELAFSDAFPYMEPEYYLPKPIIYIENDNNGDSKQKKAYKKMSYVPLSAFDDYLKGSMSVKRTEDLENLGRSETRTLASVRGEEETKPYRVGVYHFNEDCGLYVIVGYTEKKALELVEKLLTGLSYSGIGGKRNAGLGRFVFDREEVPKELLERLQKPSPCAMTLASALPKDDELEAALDGASYLLIKRSGFVASAHYADEYLRKKDMYTFQAGSCFVHQFHGNVYDVSSGGAHPVYRYAKPMFMGVMQ